MTELVVNGRTSRELGETVSEKDMMLFSNEKMNFRIISQHITLTCLIIAIA